MKFEERVIKKVEIKEVDDLLKASLGEIQLIEGGLAVESNLSELIEEAELKTKITIMKKIVEIPVRRSLYTKLKGKKIKLVPK